MPSSTDPSLPSAPALRLVNTDHRTPATPTRPRHARAPHAPHTARPHAPTPPQAREAADLCATDPRWVLAVRAASALDAGRAGLIAPDRRDALLRTARALGIRPFDAHLVIAIVQDAARAGLPPLGHDTAQRLALLEVPRVSPAYPRSASTLQSIAGVLIVAASLLAAALLWLHGS